MAHWALKADFLNIGHRGAANLAPENTLPSIQAGLDAGADAIEIDIVQTRDGHLVLLHDDTVDRTTNGTGPIADMTLAEAKALDAGYRFERDGAFPFRGTGITIPTWAEALAAFPEAHWDVEVKQTDPAIYDRVIAEIEAAGAKDRVFIACFDDATIQLVRAMHPDYVTNFGWGECEELGRRIDAPGYQPPGELLQVQAHHVTPEVVRYIESWNRRVHVWTVNDVVTMQALIELGVHAIITDTPDLLQEVRP